MFNRFSPECTLPSNETFSGFVSGPNARSTLSIVWSCISIIILSTWSILHLDVPAHVTPKTFGQSICRSVYLLWRKIFWMGLKLFSPEFAATGCARKIFATRSNSAELQRLARIDGVIWSLTHTILVDMGGIALRFPDPPNRTLTGEDIPTAAPRPEPVTESASEAEITNFIERFCRRQELIAWYCGKIPWKLHGPHNHFARMMMRDPDLPISIRKDVAALAGNIWILDSIQLKIARQKGIIKMPNITEQEINDKSKSDGLVKLIAILQVLWLVIQLIARSIQNLPFTQLEITTAAFAATAIIIYCIDFIKPKDVNIPFYVDVSEKVIVQYRDFVEIAQAAPFAYVQGKRYYMPTSTIHDLFKYQKPLEPNGKCKEGLCDRCKRCKRCKWCRMRVDESAEDEKHQKCWKCKKFRLSPLAADIYSLLIGFFSATSFGGVHLFAWNNQFPTKVEQLLWRISALMTILLPYIYISTHLPFLGKPVKDIRADTRRGMRIGLFCIAVCYVPCRLFLLTESFRSLYYLPPEAFISTWAGDFPHLG